MKDREFLIWIYYKLVEDYSESELRGYMHTFRKIISAIDEKKETSNVNSKNSMEEMKKDLEG